MPLREALAHAAAILRAAGIESARLDARVLLAHCLGVSSEALLAADDSPAERLEDFQALIARRAAREPVAYITGVREFWSLAFAVGPGVLIPRPETETLVEAANGEFPDTARTLRVLDFGTGSGCLLVAFLADRLQAAGVGVDCSDAALGYARRNLAAHGLGDRILLQRSDWSQSWERGFDVVFANPPYLSEAEFDRAPPEIRNHEPKSALVAGVDGFACIRELGPALARVLAPSGRAFLEIGAGQCRASSKILSSCGLEVRRAIPDLSGVPRCLVIGQRGQGGA